MNTAVTKWSLAVAMATALLVSTTPVMAEQREGSLDDELEQYWATERDIDVIEERLFQRDGRFGAGLFMGLLASEPFFQYFPVGGRLSYHFSNHLGVEVGGSFMDAGLLHRGTELNRFVTCEYIEECRWRDGDRPDDFETDGTFDPVADAQDRFMWRTNAVVLWSPFYGKIAALQQKLLHFDLNIAAGFGAVGVERPESDRSGTLTTAAPEFVIGGGAHFYLGENLVLRLDGRGFLYRGPELPIHEEDPDDEDYSPPTRMRFPTEFNLGITYLF